MTPHGGTAGALAALTWFCAGAAAAQSVRATHRSGADLAPPTLSAPAANEQRAASVLARSASAAGERWRVPATPFVAPAGPVAMYRALAAPAQNPEEARLREFVYDIIGPGAILGTAVAAVSLQAINDPSEWGRGWSGLGRRAASTEGQIVAQETLRYWTAIAMNRSTRYQRCNCTAFNPRVKHAFIETFTDRDAAGRRAFSYARVFGAFGGSAVRMVWWPDPTVGRTALGGAASLLFTFVGNVMTEYTRLPL